MGNDTMGRLIAAIVMNEIKKSKFAYDAVGNMLAASNNVAEVIFAYDTMNRLVSAENHYMLANGSPLAFTTSYNRDFGGLVTNLTYAAGKPVRYAYDEDGQLASVKDWLGNTWSFTRDAMGCVILLESPVSSPAAYTYDAAGRLSAYDLPNIAGRTITYDEADRRIADDITAGPLPKPTLQRTAQNTFDAADRLVSASVRYGQGTNSTPHITETFSYDRNGAMTQWVSGTNVLNLTYDELGRFANDATAYDALGNRIRTADGKYWVPNHADPLKRPLIECAADGSVLRHFIWADDRLLGFIDASGLLTVAHCDEQGSVMALTDANGNILHTAFYGPYGEDWGSTGTNPTPFTWLGGHGVQTIDSDTPLRLYLTRHRVYSATLNRFLSADPISLEGGLNLYAYGEGNPLSYIDPLGLAPTPAEAALMADRVYANSKGEGLQETLMGGWKWAIIYTPEKSSVNMVAYSRVNPSGQVEYALVNKGTVPASLSDWKNNTTQPFGGSPDMKESIEIARQFVAIYPNSEVTMIGHSKGGAEAAANAVATGANAMIFNPASVNLSAYDLNASNYSGNMTAYIVKREILNNIFGSISTPIGNVVYLPQQHGGQWYDVFKPGILHAVDSVQNHLMSSVHMGLFQAGYQGGYK